MFHYHELEELKQLIEKLRQKALDIALIVEGESDKQALQALGVKSDFFLACRTKSSLQITAEKIAEKHKQAILMLDYDKKGKQLTKKMKNHLQQLGVKVNTELGRLILIKANSSTVEGLAKLA